MNRSVFDVSSVLAFYYAAELGSITGAARVCNISQAAMSNRVKQAEADVGVLLVDRSRHGTSIRMTEEGRIIKCGVRKMLLQFSDTMLEIRGVPRIIRICCSTRLFTGDLISLISRFRLRYPDVSFCIFSTTDDEAVKMLRNGVATHALIPCPPNRRIGSTKTDVYPGTDPSIVLKHRVGIVTSEWVPLSEKRYVTPDDLRHYSAIFPADDILEDLLRGWFGNGPSQHAVLKTCTAGEALMGACNGTGYAILPYNRMIRSLYGMCFRPLYPEVTLEASIITCTENTRSRSVMLWDSFLAEQVNQGSR